MTEAEIALLKADIKAEVIKELSGQDIRTAQDISRPLAILYAKYRKPLYEKFGVVKWAKAWESVRLLATFRAGHRYVRDLLPSEEVEAAEFAESLLLMMGVGEEPNEKEGVTE
jgi:hypothetical protein